MDDLMEYVPGPKEERNMSISYKITRGDCAQDAMLTKRIADC